MQVVTVVEPCGFGGAAGPDSGRCGLGTALSTSGTRHLSRRGSWESRQVWAATPRQAGVSPALGPGAGLCGEGSRSGLLRHGSKVSPWSQWHSVAVTVAGYFGTGGGSVL